MNCLLRYVAALTISTTAFACSSTTTVQQPDGGAPNDASAPLSEAAKSSANYGQCKAACAAPADGPCKAANVNACIEKCTAFTEGLAPGCVQCVIEHSEYTGIECVPSSCGTTCPDVQCAYPRCAKSNCSDGQAPTCAPACTASDDRCDGFKLARSTDSACTSLCK